MPNLRAGFVITASLSASTVLSASELLAEGVAPIPLDGFTVVEGTVCLTAVSSPDDEVRDILAAGLGKAKTQIKTCKSTIRKYSIAKSLATYLSLVVWEECYASSPLTEYSLGARSGYQHSEWGCAPHHSFPQMLPHLHNQG